LQTTPAVAIRVDHVRRIVARVIIDASARRTIVPPARFNRGGISGVNLRLDIATKPTQLAETLSFEAIVVSLS
jgi:hypothetical protein